MHKTDIDRIDKATSMEALSDIALDVRARMDIEGASEAEFEEIEQAIRAKVERLSSMLVAG